MKRNRFKKPPAKRSKRFKAGGQPEDIDFDALPPIFSLKHMQYGGVSCITNCQRNDKSVILEKLLRLSQLEWKEIHSKPKAGLGYETIPQGSFTRALPPIVTPEVNILVFRYSDAGRIAGFRVKDIYHIIMVGEDLYPH